MSDSSVAPAVPYLGDFNWDVDHVVDANRKEKVREVGASIDDLKGLRLPSQHLHHKVGLTLPPSKVNKQVRKNLSKRTAVSPNALYALTGACEELVAIVLAASAAQAQSDGVRRISKETVTAALEVNAKAFGARVVSK